MGLFDKFTSAVGGMLSGFGDDLDEQLAKYTSKEFGEGCMAIASAVMWADGTCSPDEKAKLSQFLQVNPTLKNMDRSKLIAFFGEMNLQFDMDYNMGLDEARKQAKQVKDTEQRRMMLRLAVMIAKSAKAGESDTSPISPEEANTIGIFCDDLGFARREFLG